MDLKQKQLANVFQSETTLAGSQKNGKNSACLIMTKDSQEFVLLAFGHEGFLTKYIKPKNGRIIYKNKQMEFMMAFITTIGQRHGLILASGADHICCFKDIKRTLFMSGMRKICY